jgi:hypothetical protein
MVPDVNTAAGRSQPLLEEVLHVPAVHYIEGGKRRL